MASAVAVVVLQELVTPVAEALVTVTGLLAVGAGVVLQPVDEQVLVLLQDQKLKWRKKNIKATRLKINFHSSTVSQLHDIVLDSLDIIL